MISPRMASGRPLMRSPPQKHPPPPSSPAPSGGGGGCPCGLPVDLGWGGSVAICRRWPRAQLVEAGEPAIASGSTPPSHSPAGAARGGGRRPESRNNPRRIGGLLCIVRKTIKLRIAKPIAAHVSWKAQPTSILDIKYTKDKPVVCAFVHSRATK